MKIVPRLSIPALVFAAGYVASGCAAAGWGFRETAFIPEFRHFQIGYVDADARDVTSEGWQPDNYHRDGAGTIRINETDEYSTRYGFDTNNDGAADRTYTRPLYDLRLSHRGDGSVMFVRSIPLRHDLAERTLESLAHDYVDAVAGTTVVAVALTDRVAASASTHATQVVSERELALDRRRAYEIIFDVIDLDQHEVDAAAVSSRVRLVLARPVSGFEYQANAWVTAPMIVALGYAAEPENFERHAADFEDLLRRFTWSRAEGQDRATATR
jgi:hypothetical protein